jgi:glycosyltransferase involved in cell wall biosynthesis
VASAIAQTEPFDEIVVVENHSTDGTAESLQAYAGRVRIVHPPNHLGMVDNWNYCVSQMNGEWFSLLSGDDRLKPEFAGAVRKAIAAHPSAALIRTDWDVIDGEGAVRRTHRQLSVSRVTTPPRTWQEQLHGPKVSFAAFAARHDLWRSVGGFRADFHLFQDWMFWLDLAPFGPFIRVPASLAQYRVCERPELEQKRARLRVLDEYRYLTDVMPALPWQGLTRGRKIMAVRQKRLRNLLNYLIPYRSVMGDDDCRKRLEALAVASGMADHYQAWRANQEPIRPPLADRLITGLKSAVRQAVG